MNVTEELELALQPPGTLTTRPAWMPAADEPHTALVEQPFVTREIPCPCARCIAHRFACWQAQDEWRQRRHTEAILARDAARRKREADAESLRNAVLFAAKVVAVLIFLSFFVTECHTTLHSVIERGF